MQKLVVDILINRVLAWITRWLDQNTPTARIQKHSRPAPIVKKKKSGKYGDPYAPGQWNWIEGKWNT